jgi:hypothetical protein
MRRLAIIAAIALLGTMTPALAEEVVTSGEDLLPSCREFVEGRYESRGLRTGICVGAVYSALTLTQNLCAPHNATLLKAVKLVTNYMLRHSEQLHMDIVLLSVNALTEAWPCRKEQ